VGLLGIYPKLGLVFVELVYLLGIDLAAIAAGSPFGTKVGAGIILPFLLMVMTTERGVRVGGRADVEAIAAGGLTAIAISAMWLCWHSLAASQCSFTFFPVWDHSFFSLLWLLEPQPEVAGCLSLNFPFQDSSWLGLRLTVEILFADCEGHETPARCWCFLMITLATMPYSSLLSK